MIVYLSEDCLSNGLDMGKSSFFLFGVWELNASTLSFIFYTFFVMTFDWKWYWKYSVSCYVWYQLFDLFRVKSKYHRCLLNVKFCQQFYEPTLEEKYCCFVKNTIFFFRLHIFQYFWKLFLGQHENASFNFWKLLIKSFVVKKWTCFLPFFHLCGKTKVRIFKSNNLIMQTYFSLGQPSGAKSPKHLLYKVYPTTFCCIFY